MTAPRAARPVVAVVCMPEFGHFQRLRGVITALRAGGAEVFVFTDRRFAAAAEAAGGRFVDLFARHRVEDADDESSPVPCRYVTHAGRFLEAITGLIGSVRPRVVVYESFAVAAPLAARRLGLPAVCVLGGHAVAPSARRAQVARSARVDVSPRCLDAVARLRDVHGLADASPFSYVGDPSPWLNLACEPAEWLTAEERHRSAPVACVGSLAGTDAPPPGPSAFDDAASDGATSAAGVRRVYAAFGGIVWRYYADEALATLRSLLVAAARRPELRLLVSLGGHAPARAALATEAAPNARVETRVDQWRVLHEADVFVTHQGLNSTHEAAWCGVPMLSCPFFWDQPALAARAAELGLARPLAPAPRTAPEPEAVLSALDDLDARRDALAVRFRRARAWEQDAVDGRADVVKRILSLDAGGLQDVAGAQGATGAWGAAGT